MKKVITAFLSLLLLCSLSLPALADTDGLEFTKLTVEFPEEEEEQDTGDDIWELIATGRLHLTVTAHYTDRTNEELIDLNPAACDIYPDTILEDRNTYSIYYKDRESGIRKRATFRLTGVGQIYETFEKNRSNGKWYMQASDGSFYMNTWKRVDGSWYLFDEYGFLASGWQQRGGKWYYLDENNHKLVTGWYTENGIRYYMNPSDGGAMATGWARVNDIWYYFRENGFPASGWIQDAGQWYYINPDGTMYTGWLKNNDIWYYLTPESGACATGWRVVNGHWYYFAGNGAMAVNTVIDGYYVNSDGIWVQ